MLSAENRDQLIPLLVGDELFEPIIAGLDSADLLRCQVAGAKRPIRILTVLHAKRPICSQAIDNGLDL